jgi:hypothetical protein
MRWTVVMWWMAAVSCGRGAPAGGEEHTSQQDAGPTLSCESLLQEWWAFVEENRACAGDGECTVVGEWGSCSCTPFPFQTALARSARDSAQRYLDAARECPAIRSMCVADAAPAGAPRCQEGRCAAPSSSCF